MKNDQAERFVRVAFPDAHVLWTEPVAPHRWKIGLRETAFPLPSPLFLRFYPLGSPLGSTACCREQAVRTVLPNLVPVATIHHAAPEADPPWTLSTWLADGPLSAALRMARSWQARARWKWIVDTPSPAIADEEVLMLANDAGALLSALHRVRYPRSGLLGPDLSLRDPLPKWSERMAAYLRGGLEARMAPTLLGRLDSFVAAHAVEMDDLYRDAALCHGAFVPGNLIVYLSSGTDDRASQSGWVDWGNLLTLDRPRLAGVVEWSGVLAGPPLADLGAFLRHEEALPAGFGDAFADGYRRWDTGLPGDWRKLARGLDLVNLCERLERGDRRSVARTRALIEATVSAG